MSWLTALFIYAIVTLAALVLATACYAIWLRFRIHKLAKDVPTAQLNTAGLTSENTPIMRYSEYKHRFGSRIREIAIIANAKQPAITAVANEFTETMREHGSLLYHFTYYWGRSDTAVTQQQASELVKGNYHAVYAVGRMAVRAVHHATITQNRSLPMVFSNVRDTWWYEEQKKRPAEHITGVTGSSGWKQRIKLFAAAKPTMKSVLLPVPNGHSALRSDIDEITSLLNAYNVTVHAVTIHDGPELLNAIQQFAPQVDSVVCMQSSLISLFAPQIATACNQHSLTFFSPYKDDIFHGAAVAVSAADMNLGWHAAQKMIALLEEHKKPSEIPLTNIGPQHQYVAHFNQAAMALQGIDPTILVGLSMRYGSKVNITLEEEA